MKKIYLICSIAVVIGIAAGISFFLIRDASAKIPSEISLVDQNGQNYNFGKDQTKLKLVEFVYTHCPSVCPTTTQKMSLLQKDLQKKGVFGKDIEFITITIDPYRDTPEVLKSYMNEFHLKNDGNWIFLSGNKADNKETQKKIREVADALQFQYKDPGNGYFIHSSFTFLLDENNKFIKKFPMGKEFNKKQVYDTIMTDLN
ncbi:SCO family protein [Bacillus sp. EB600]|uniref:SCO family protein n=1 Tax=Bacillus sp. EB600 TaxID=2806345 RepID=UPI00210C75C7|nr:SCO family protein [Bacillus sp. EB600]MCQ6277732.1 SCO family protein [Bacillus sp. EB600]